MQTTTGIEIVALAICWLSWMAMRTHPLYVGVGPWLDLLQYILVVIVEEIDCVCWMYISRDCVVVYGCLHCWKSWEIVFQEQFLKYETDTCIRIHSFQHSCIWRGLGQGLSVPYTDCNVASWSLQRHFVLTVLLGYMIAVRGASNSIGWNKTGQKLPQILANGSDFIAPALEGGGYFQSLKNLLQRWCR